jgi:2-haloacid dehalogenase
MTTDQYEDFSKVTHRSLNHALAEAEVDLSEQDIGELMRAYDTLSIFSDVGPAVEKLRQADRIEGYVFSNGTNDMVSSSIHQSPDLKPYSSVFENIVVVEQVKKFKPHPETYYHLARTVGKDPTSAKDMSEMWLVSGNPFDIVGARAVGMKAAWVDRAGNGWQDAVVSGEAGRPSVMAKSLDEVVDAISKEC